MEVLGIAARTLRVTGTAIVVAFAVGVPLGAWLGLSRRRGRLAVATVVNAGMGLPPVVAGLLVAYLVARSGPFGLGWGCSVGAMVGAQVLIATPIVAGLVMASLLGLPRETHLQARALGARGWRLAAVLLPECRVGLLAAAVAGYGAIVSEVGAALMTGCNLHGTGADTRLLTTAMVEAVRRGAFGEAAALAGVLLGVVVAIYAVLTWGQHRAVGGARPELALSGRGRDG